MVGTIQDNELYMLNPVCHLRNDGKYVIAGFPNDMNVSVLRLAPLEGILACLLDGNRTVAEATEFFETMTDPDSPNPDRDARNMFNYILKRQIAAVGDMPAPLIVPKSSLSDEEIDRAPRYDPVDFIVKPEDYHPENLKLTFPASMLLLVTTKCRVNCLYCYMDKQKIGAKDLIPWDRLREVIVEARKKGLLGISVSGGDALCYPYIFELFDLMDELDMPPTPLATKCPITPEMAERLAGYRCLDELQFSIDSTVPEIADYLTQTPGYYERTMESIKNVRAAGKEKIAAKAVITPYNLPTIPKLYRDMRSIGIPVVRLATYTRSGYRHREKLFNHPDDYDWLDRELDRLREEYPDDEISYQNGPPQLEPDSRETLQRRWKDRSRCTAGRDCITMAPNGKVIACEQMPLREEDYLGDLNTQSLEEVWNSRILDEYLLHPPMEKLKGTPCYNCEEYEECQTFMGICVRDCCTQYGTRWASPPNCPKTPAEKFIRTT